MKKILFSAFVLILGSCSLTDPGNDISSIALQIDLDRAASLNDLLAKSSTITTVTVQVDGPGMSLVSASLDLDMTSRVASGSIDVPKGKRRHFVIEGKDANDEVQFSGSLTQDIETSTEEVAITAAWIVPDPVIPTITALTGSSITVSWTASTASDFAFYAPFLGTSPTLTAGDWVNDERITERSTTEYTFTGLTAGETYYLAILTVDTEEWFGGSLDYNATASILRRITLPTQSWLYYDDNTWEDYVWPTELGSGLLVGFDPPGTPAFLSGIWLNLTDNSGVDGNYRIILYDNNGDLLFRSEPVPTVAGGGMDVSWNIPFDSFQDGLVHGTFYLGIEWINQVGVPMLGIDYDSDAGASFLVDANGDFGSVNGNLAINAIVQTGWDIDSRGLLKPSGRFIPLSGEQRGSIATRIQASHVE